MVTVDGYDLECVRMGLRELIREEVADRRKAGDEIREDLEQLWVEVRALASRIGEYDVKGGG